MGNAKDIKLKHGIDRIIPLTKKIFLNLEAIELQGK